MATIPKKIDSFLVQKLWGEGQSYNRKIHGLNTKLLRILYVILRSFGEEQLILRAMSLVYTSLLSIVPLLAVSFSVLKAFGVHTRFLIILYYFLEPLGENGIDLSMKIIGFVENVKVSVLGSIGLSALIYTVISTVQKVESSLNYIWGIKDTRGFSQRFSNYMSVLLIGPVLVFTAFGITTTIMGSSIMKKAVAVQALGIAVYAASMLAPYLLIAAAFTLIYIFLPNTKVSLRAALAGGISAAVLWQTIGWIFTSFIASSAQYSAIYSGFATLILLLIWLYWNFLTLLTGARIAYYVQHPKLLEAGAKPVTVSGRMKERLAISIMFLIGRDFHSGAKHWGIPALIERFGLPPAVVHDVLTLLLKQELLVMTEGEPHACVPAKDPGAISLSEIITAVRDSGGGTPLGKPAQAVPEADTVMEHIDDAISASLGRRTLRDLITSADSRE